MPLYPPVATVLNGAMVCPLDGMPALTAGAAFSVNERLLSSYTGPLFTVRRASDNATLDVYWDSRGHCDEAAIIAFCGANVGSVTTLYDQSGYGRNLTQATAANQPTVYNGTTVQKDGSNVSMLFASSQALTRSDALGFSGSPTFTAVSLHNFANSATSPRLLFALGPDSNSAELQLVYDGAHANTLTCGVWGAALSRYGAAAASALAYLVAQHAASADLSSFAIRENGIAKAYTNNTLGTAAQAIAITNSSMSVGGFVSGGLFPVGSLSAAIFLPYTLTSQQQTSIEAWLEARRTGVQWTAQIARLVAITEPTRVYPLDAFASVLASAWSVAERVVATWAGPLFTVRRASDNTTKDIGYDSAGICDTATLAAFCSGTSGFVTKVYDQSGNGRDISQATAASQPTIYVSGAVVLKGSSVAMSFGAGTVLTRADACGFVGAPAFTAISFYSRVGGNDAFLWGLGSNNLYYDAYNTPRLSVDNGSTWANYGATGLSGVNYSVVQAPASANVSGYTVRESGNARAYSSGSTGTVSISNTGTTVGASASGGGGADGLSTQVFLTTTLTTTQLAAIEAWLEARRTSQPWQANAGSGIGRITVQGVDLVPQPLAFATSIVFDMSVGNDSAIDILTGNTTITFTNVTRGRTGTIWVKQDATGGRTVTFAATGWTVVRDTLCADLIAASGTNALTQYKYATFVAGGTNYIRILKSALV